MTLVPSSSHSPVVTTYKDLTAAQIAALGSTPVTVVPAIAGRTIVPLGGMFAYDAGTVAFADSLDALLASAGATDGIEVVVAVDATVDKSVAFAKGTSFDLLPDAALVIMATDPVGLAGTIATSSLENAGTDYVPGDTATIDDGTSGLITVSTVSGQFPIVAVATVAKTFTVTGDAHLVITAGTGLRVIRSTGNDGAFTVVSSIFGAGQTVITVVEVIGSAVADGKAEPDNADGGAILTYALTNGGTGYTVAEHDITSVGPGVGLGASINALTLSSPSNGTARVTAYYAVV